MTLPTIRKDQTNTRDTVVLVKIIFLWSYSNRGPIKSSKEYFRGLTWKQAKYKELFQNTILSHSPVLIDPGNFWACKEPALLWLSLINLTVCSKHSAEQTFLQEMTFSPSQEVMSFKGADFLHHEQFLGGFPGKAVHGVISTPAWVQIKPRGRE